eukprot:CFRG6584T1
MKLSIVALAVACVVSSTHAIDPNCSKVKVVASVGPGCSSALLTATAPTDGECIAVSIGSLKVTMNGDKAEGGAYRSPDCSGTALASVSTGLENTCVNAGIASFKISCVATTEPDTDPETDPDTPDPTEPDTDPETDPDTPDTTPDTPETNEYLITCDEKAIRNPTSLVGVSIDGPKKCCQWSGKCGDLRKCTKSYCKTSNLEPEASAAWDSDFVVQI